MGNHIISENVFLLYSLFTGVLMTFTYDLFRIFRRVIRHNRIWISIEDILFWFGCGVTVFVLMQRESNGMLRWFAVLGAMAGMLLYRRCLGRYLVDILSRFFLKGKRILCKPIAAVGKRCRKVTGFAGKKAGRFRLYLKNRLTRVRKTIKMILCKQ